ncbi:hypothetical protein TKK_0000967 [Trichogramma kaykai]|uniref:DUF1279 domain-containing protein n=1 Tax=Trichogramma kaykai TaxID=54128 RepID=A0ABD2VX16_9HYME
MELIINSGVKYAKLLMPRIQQSTSKFLPAIHHVQICSANGQMQFSDYHRYRHCQSNVHCNLKNLGLLDLPKLNVCKYEMSAVEYSTSTKPESSTKDASCEKVCHEPPAAANPSIFQKMKQLGKDYWHILIPVHVVTSIGWASIFYIAAKNGVDIVGILEYLKLSEEYLEKIRGSSAGHWAVTYALYKVFTPVRYTVTVGGTTMCIRYLNKWGYMKSSELVEYAKAKKASVVERRNLKKQSKS